MREHKIIEEWGRFYLACNECWNLKELIDKFWVRDNKSKYWFVYKCKDCLHKRANIAAHKYYLSHKDKTHEYNIKYNREHRDEIRDKRRENREQENIKRKKKMKEISVKQTKHAKDMGYWWIHDKTCRVIKKLWIRPKECPICNYKWLVISHHPDYNKWNEIVFCCNSCHKLIHNWEIDVKYRIIRIWESDWDKWMVKCSSCWMLIPKISTKKYCDECRKKAHREAQIRYKNNHR